MTLSYGPAARTVGSSHARATPGAPARTAAILSAFLVSAGARLAPAQQPRADVTWLEATANSELETYLRVAQVAGVVPLGSLSIRPFGPRELDALVGDTLRAQRSPWRPRGRAVGRDAALLPLSGNVAYTANAPYAYNDGPVWEGRGATVSGSVGGAVRVGPLTMVGQPVAFVTQNRAFPLFPTAPGTDPRIQLLDYHASLPTSIDLPQRFGTSSYGRVDPGQSSARLDIGPAAVGVSTSAQGWGPAVWSPLIMGPNAPGFRHIFYGTSRPTSIFIGQLHFRGVLGQLDDSPVPPPNTRPRIQTGAVAVFTPAGLPGLEIGATRVFQVWRVGSGLTLRNALRPYKELLRTSQQRAIADQPYTPGYTPDNELASAFASWTFPTVGFRAYGEYLRNDNPASTLDAITEPDHSAAYVLGLQRVRQIGKGARARLVSIRAEVANGRVTHLERIRPEVMQYEHTPINQGYTERGQLLGSVALLGGAGEQLAVDAYDRRGRLTVSFERLVADQRGRAGTEGADPSGWDVQHALTAERVWFGRRFDVNASLTGIYELNRYFQHDVGNVRASTGIRWPFR